LDARRTNKIIIPDYEGPIPPDEIFQKFNSKKFLSTFDLTSSLWQVPLSEDSKQHTGFLYRGQSYVFNVVPFGLCISMASLNRCLKELLGHEILHYTRVYVDDLLCASTTFEEHCPHTDKLLQRIIDIGMTLRLDKTLLCRDQVPYFGMILTPEGAKSNPHKLQAIEEFRRPHDINSLQQFTGTCGYLQRFYRKYAQTVSPIYELLQDSKIWVWTDVHEEVFLQTKNIFK
jgi:hypothetical protein